METNQQKVHRIRLQKIWRVVNSVIGSIALLIALIAYIIVPDVLERREYNTEIKQLIMDEGIRYKPYKDKLGKLTIGVGHLVLSHEKFGELTPSEVLNLLRKDYDIARRHVSNKYSWANHDAQLVLTNMVFQMGPTGVSKFENMLSALKVEDYELAALEMMDSKWSRQTPTRANRLTGRILELDNDWW